MHNSFTSDQYLLKRQVFALTGKVRLYDSQSLLVMYSEQKMFKLREDIRVFADEGKSSEILTIKARNILDFSAAYDVMDSMTGEKVGVLRRKGIKSMLRDEWELLDANDQPIGKLFEDNLSLALLRRFLLGTLLPQKYEIKLADQPLASFRQRFNPFRFEMAIDFGLDQTSRLDRRLGLALAVLLGMIEGRQD